VAVYKREESEDEGKRWKYGGGEAGGRGVGGERSYTSNRSTPRDTHWQILDDVLARRTKRRHGNRLFFFFYFYFFHYLLNSLFFSLFSN
jgi:hypothetical protein